MRKTVLARMLQYIKPHKLLLLGAFLSALLSVPLSLFAPILIGSAIDSIIGAGKVDFNAIQPILLLLAVTVLGAGFLQWVMQVCTRNLSVVAAQEMRQQAFDSMNKAPIKQIDTHIHGDVVSRLVNDADAVAEGLLQGLTQLFPGVVTIVATIGLMMTLNKVIAIVVIVVTPLSIIFSRIVARRTSQMFRQQSVAQGDLSGFVGEMVQNQLLIRSFGYEEESVKEFEKYSETYFNTNFKATFYSSISNPGTRFINALVYAAVGVFGALLALSGGISVGGLSAFLSYANQYTKPFNDVSAVLTQIQGAFASAERLFEIIDWLPEQGDQPESISMESCQGDVRLCNVNFSYQPDRPLIQDFTLHAKPGRRIALVGPTGCGKTTIINLLMRYYEIDSGTLFVDDKEIQSIRRSSLRGLYGMVLQETWLKQATVRENIAYACPDAAIGEVMEAAKAAYAHNFILGLPNGYDTVLESGGNNLSAGQKQLLCIARIMLAKPDMLILDEATSSIDTRTEMLIQKALEKLMQGHTSFIVAHRLSTIQNADCILVMKSGRIVEQGNHQELLERNGFYATLYKSQFGSLV